MTAPTRFVWELHGRPDLIEKAEAMMTDTPGVCAVCNKESDRTAPANKALGKNFTDRSLITGPGSRVCHACLWACSGKGRESARPWSIAASRLKKMPAHADKAQAWAGETPGLCYTTRGNTRPIIDLLLNPPEGEWLASVATSGQKHVLPYATVNAGKESWTVRVETVNVTSTPTEFSEILTTVAKLRQAGHRQDDIKEGAPTIAAIKTEADLEEWEKQSQRIRHYTHSPVLDLAGWLLTKETINDY